VCRAREASPCDPELRRLDSLITVGFLIARAALRREESRGGHFRSDFPRRDDIHWQKHVADARAS
jgi:L-aspartate oxidase